MITEKSDTVRLQDYIHAYSKGLLRLSKFRLCGLGEAGRDCGKVVMTDVDVRESVNKDGIKKYDINAVKFKPLRCSRVECPTCYYEWAIRQTFDIVLRVEALALIRGERPYHVVFSVRPDKCDKMTWGNVNQSLWRRGVRRLRYIRCDTAREFEAHTIEDCPDCYENGIRCSVNKRGLDHKIGDCPDCYDLTLKQFGGIGIFHPCRVKRKWRSRWGDRANVTVEDDLGGGKYWEKIRANVESGLNKLEKYATIGFHAHNWVFTDHADKQENKEYLIKFCQNFKRFDTKEVVALTRYLVTHTATLRETAIYRNHRCKCCGHSSLVNFERCGHCGRKDIIEERVERNRIIHPIRSFGMLHRFDPKKELIKKFGVEKGTKLYHELAHKIADLLYIRNENGEIVSMEWNEETEELDYPASAEELATSDEHANWISIWKLLDMFYNDDFMLALSGEDREFVEDLRDYVRCEGKPPPIEECGRSLNDVLIIPDSVRIVAPIKDLKKKSKRGRGRSLREKIVGLVMKGENDVFKLDICLADTSMGSILRTVDLLCEDGSLIKGLDGVLSLGAIW